MAKMYLKRLSFKLILSRFKLSSVKNENLITNNYDGRKKKRQQA